MEQDLKNKTEEYWRQKLTKEQYEVMRKAKTEAPFTGKYWQNKEKGTYKCAACGQELFSSETKFDSGTGWPSFTNPVNLEQVELKQDLSHGMTRTEVLCKKCGSHLGHVFDDLSASSQKTAEQNKNGKRFCINSCSLDFESK